MRSMEDIMKYTCKQTEIVGADLERIARASMEISLDRDLVVRMIADEWFGEYGTENGTDFNQVTEDTLIHIYSHPGCRTIFEEACAMSLEGQVGYVDHVQTEAALETIVPGYKEAKRARFEEDVARLEERYAGLKEMFLESLREGERKHPGLVERISDPAKWQKTYTPEQAQMMRERDYSKLIGIVNKMDEPYYTRSLNALDRLGFLDCMKEQGLNVPEGYCSVETLN